MKNAVKIRQSRIAAVAQSLDAAAAIAQDSAILLRILRLKEQALECHAKGLNARRADRALSREMQPLLQAASGDPAEILPVLERIENMLFEREIPRSASRRDELTRAKRALFAQWRQQAVQIDLWTSRKQALAQAGAELEGPAAQINREQFDACERRLLAAQRAFAQTWTALRAMDSVLLMHSEEESLRRLEKIYRSTLPDPDAFQEEVWKTEIRSDLLGEKMDRIIFAKKFSETRDDSDFAALNLSESNGTPEPKSRSEFTDDQHQKYSRQSQEGPPVEAFG